MIVPLCRASVALFGGGRGGQRLGPEQLTGRAGVPARIVDLVVVGPAASRSERQNDISVGVDKAVIASLHVSIGELRGRLEWDVAAPAAGA